MRQFIYYIEEIRIKSDAKKMKYYQISKTIIALYYCKLSANSSQWQWVLLWVQPLQMHFYAIMKTNDWRIFQSTLNL